MARWLLTIGGILVVDIRTPEGTAGLGVTANANAGGDHKSAEEHQKTQHDTGHLPLYVSDLLKHPTNFRFSDGGVKVNDKERSRAESSGGGGFSGDFRNSGIRHVGRVVSSAEKKDESQGELLK